MDFLLGAGALLVGIALAAAFFVYAVLPAVKADAKQDDADADKARADGLQVGVDAINNHVKRQEAAIDAAADSDKATDPVAVANRLLAEAKRGQP